VCENRSFVVHDADVHCPCVQIDSAVKSMVFGVESHKASSLGYGFLDESIIPCLQEGALMSIKSLELTGVRRSGSRHMVDNRDSADLRRACSSTLCSTHITDRGHRRLQ
jgi:hypothetical protein